MITADQSKSFSHTEVKLTAIDDFLQLYNIHIYIINRAIDLDHNSIAKKAQH